MITNTIPISVGVDTDKRSYNWILIGLALLFVLCTFRFINTLSNEPSIESSKALWGFFVANYIYFLGVSMFGVVFVAILRICGAGWSRPYYRLAELTTLAFFPFAILGFLYITQYGSEYLFYWVTDDEHHSPWLNSTFLLYRNMFALLLFYLLSLVYFLAGLLPDISLQDAEQGPVIRQKCYRWLLSIKQNKDEASLKRNVYFYSPLIILAAALAMTFISWDFGMMLVPHYHSSVYPMYFIIGNMLAGTASLIIFAMVLIRFVPVSNHFKTRQVHFIAVLLTVFTLFWLYLFWAQFFVSWFGNLEHEYGVLSLQMYGHYAPLFWAMMVCNVAIPIACYIFIKIKQNWWAMALLAITINVGIWINRYLLVIPGLVNDHWPFSSFTELCMTVGLLAGFLTVLLILFNIIPMVSNWELQAWEDER